NLARFPNPNGLDPAPPERVAKRCRLIAVKLEQIQGNRLKNGFNKLRIRVYEQAGYRYKSRHPGYQQLCLRYGDRPGAGLIEHKAYRVRPAGNRRCNVLLAGQATY